MDGNHNGGFVTKTLIEDPSCRCAWCGLALPLDARPAAPTSDLCPACSEILRGVDWPRLLADSRRRD